MASEETRPPIDREDGTSYSETSILLDFSEGFAYTQAHAEMRDYDEMLDRDGKANTLAAVLTLPLRQASFSIVRGPADREVADFIERVLTQPANNGGMSTPLNMVIAQMAQAIIYRKAFFEKVFTLREGRVVYDKIAYRPPSTCVVVRDPKTAAFQGFRQRPWRAEAADDVFIPPNRALVYVHGTHRDPLEGVSDMAVPYWCYLTKQKIRFLWYSFLEGQALPKTIVKGKDPVKRNAAVKRVAQLKSGGIIGVDDDVTVDPYESSGKGADQFQQAMRWLDSEASNAVLAGFTDLGAAAAQGTGSFALSKDQTDFFLMSRQAVAREMADVINQWVIPDLVKWNFGVKAESPMFQFAPITKDDVSMSMGLLQTFAQNQDGGTQIPKEFVNELVERVAGHLDMNVERVREGLDRVVESVAPKAEAQGIPAPVADVGARVGALKSAVDQRIRAA